MQRYGDFWLIPNDQPFSFSTCCDGLFDLRQTAVMGYIYVVFTRGSGCWGGCWGQAPK